MATSDRLARLSTWIEATFVAEHVRSAGYDDARKGRLQATFILGYLAIPAAFLVIGLTVGGMPPASMMTMVPELVVLAAAVLHLRTRGVLAVSGNLFVGTYFTVCAVAAAVSGGLETTAAVWLMLAPMLALLLVGTRTGVFWFGMVVLTLVALVVGHHLDLIATPETSPLQVYGSLINVGGGGLVAFGCASLYESAKREMLTQIDGARRQAEEALAGTRLVLDHVNDALLVVRRDGRIEPGRSAVVERVFGAVGADDRLWDVVGRVDGHAAAWIEASWDCAFDGVMPQEVVLAQLPATLRGGGRTFGAGYVAVPGAQDRVLVVFRDITSEVAAEAAEQEDRELVGIVGRLVRDPSTFSGYWRELGEIVAKIADPEQPPISVARQLHTLKGNAGLLGLSTIASLCHAAESRAAEAGVAVIDDDRAAIVGTFRRFDERLSGVLPDASDTVVVPRGSYERVVEAALDPRRRGEVTSALLAWGFDAVGPQLAVLAERATDLAQRLDRQVIVGVRGGGTRVPHGAFTAFFASLAHVVRNAVDHGVEPVPERRAAGKADVAHLELCDRVEGDRIVVEVADDGRGIVWEKVAAAARRRRLPVSTQADLVAALFADGVTSRDTVTETSGRGVGLAAVREAVDQLGGTIDVESTPGRGTRFRFTFPIADVVDPRCGEHAARAVTNAA